ncbi:hypothetical protein [Microvirga puerhi]|uniref:Uncharacterized protein n=1 Tax=Microvirga puerhi TaxID=2876078 RepID=A0ABS7VIZ2_9HYPH|nr:hypothetical protein [Microvirga puerhi]MBZ6075471.1 hypothetical protein [Microvirga puerhi]
MMLKAYFGAIAVGAALALVSVGSAAELPAKRYHPWPDELMFGQSCTSMDNIVSCKNDYPLRRSILFIPEEYQVLLKTLAYWERRPTTMCLCDADPLEDIMLMRRLFLKQRLEP